MKSAMLVSLSATLAAALSATMPAHASDWSNAVDICQGSLPSFEGALRKRPLGIANEGTSNAFVGCSIRAPLGGEIITRVVALFTNRSASSQTFSCTLVDGIAPPFSGYTPVYQPKAIIIAADDWETLQWTDSADNGDDPYDLPNLNCGLPPGVEINVVQMITETLI